MIMLKCTEDDDISLIGGKDKNNWPKFGRRHGPRQEGKPGQM